jgi:hypothetical protein
MQCGSHLANSFGARARTVGRFFAKVKVQAVREKEEKKEKFQASTGGEKRWKRGKT